MPCDKLCARNIDFNNKLCAQPSNLRDNKRYLFMVHILPKDKFWTKIDYLDLLLENPDGITASEISEIYLETTKDAAGHALYRLKKEGCAIRKKGTKEYTYYLTDKGAMKLGHLKK